MRRTIASGACLLMMACGGGAAEEPAEEVEVAATQTSGAEQEPTAWADMDHEQRAAFMAEVVVPTMKPLFQEFDPEEFAEFNCATCHGDDAHDVGFHMPNGLHPLNPEHIPSMFESPDPEVQRTAVFMSEQVVGTMAELLGEEAYDPETHEGFGCMSCHATLEPPAE